MRAIAMEYIPSINRNQWEFYCLEEALEADHPVRFIEAFVDKLELQALSFVPRPIQKEGRPAFNFKVFLKPYPRVMHSAACCEITTQQRRCSGLKYANQVPESTSLEDPKQAET